MALGGHGDVVSLDFDLPRRRLTILHRGRVDGLERALQGLGLGARLAETRETDLSAPPVAASAAVDEARTLLTLLGINASMFVVELVAGWVSQSTGLLADSLDMLADAAVYGLALFGAGRTGAAQLRAAHVSGWIEMALAIGAFAEVARRALIGSDPQSHVMVGISSLALVANVACLVLIARHRHAGAHMRASFIFSANDVLANVGVILAGTLVAWTGSRVPDLVIGVLIAAVVFAGAVRILRLR